MEITIFNKITTEGVITSIEENSKKYHVGFYADMTKAPERKLVKESASEIGGIIKEIEAARISITKANTAAVNKEHGAILERLKIANAPFQTLIDEYAAERKVTLDAEKARKAVIELAEQKECDHEFALLMDSKFDADILAEEVARVEYENQLKQQAARDAVALVEREKENAIIAETDAKEKLAQAERDRIASVERERLTAIQADADKKQVVIDAEQARLYSVEAERLAGIERQRVAQQDIDDEAARKLADVNHVRIINRAIYKSFTDAGLTTECAKLATQALIDNKVSNTIINY